MKKDCEEKIRILTCVYVEMNNFLRFDAQTDFFISISFLVIFGKCLFNWFTCNLWACITKYLSNVQFGLGSEFRLDWRLRWKSWHFRRQRTKLLEVLTSNVFFNFKIFCRKLALFKGLPIVDCRLEKSVRPTWIACKGFCELVI